MASSNMRALWEARADQELENLSVKPNLSNQRKLSNNEEQHRPRLGSNRRTYSATNRVKKSLESEKLNTDIMALDSILLR